MKKKLYLVFQQFMLNSDKMIAERAGRKGKKSKPFSKSWAEIERGLQQRGFIVSSNQNQIAGVPVSVLVGRILNFSPRLPVKENFFVPINTWELPFEMREGFLGQIAEL